MKAHYTKAMLAITEHTALDENEVLHSLKSEAVSARHTLFFALYSLGYTPRQIAAHTSQTSRAVSYAVVRFTDRKRTLRYVDYLFEAVMKELRNV